MFVLRYPVSTRSNGSVTLEFTFSFIFFLFFVLAATSYGLGLVAEQILSFQATRQAERAVVVVSDVFDDNSSEYSNRLCDYYRATNVPLDSGFPISFAPIKRRNILLVPSEHGNGGTVLVQLTAGFDLVKSSPISFLTLFQKFTVQGAAQVSGPLDKTRVCGA